MVCIEISWHDLQIRQVSGNFADWTVQFANWLANLQIGRLADWMAYTHTLTAQMQRGAAKPGYCAVNCNTIPDKSYYRVFYNQICQYTSNLANLLLTVSDRRPPSSRNTKCTRMCWRTKRKRAINPGTLGSDRNHDNKINMATGKATFPFCPLIVDFCLQCHDDSKLMEIFTKTTFNRNLCSIFRV